MRFFIIIFFILVSFGYSSDLILPPNVENCAHYDFDSNILDIPCLKIGTNSYWIKLKLVDIVAVKLELSDYGVINSNNLDFPPSTDIGSLIECAYFNQSNYQLHIPCALIGDKSYWLNLQLIDVEPIKLQLTGVGEN